MGCIWAWLHANSGAITALAAVFSAAVVLVTALLARKRLEQIVRTRQLQLILTLQERLATEKERAAREFVYFDLPESPSDLLDADKPMVRLVLQSMDYLGYMVHSGAMPKKFLFDLYLEVIYNCWHKLGPYVMEEREKRHIPRFKCFFEHIAKESQKAARTYYPETGEIPLFTYRSGL